MRPIILILSCAAVIALPAPPPDGDSRIVGGEPVAGDPGPVAAVVDHFAASTEGHLCGGVVVGERHVLTSARCVAGRVPAQLDVVTGRTELGASTGSRIRVLGISVHPGFDGARTYDAALLTLADPTGAPVAEWGRVAEPGDTAEVFGWGETRTGGGSSVLHAVTVAVLTDAECVESYGADFVAGAMLCAGELVTGGVDFCDGDEGGPLLSADGTLVGLASWHVGCAVEGFPGVYTAATALATWVEASGSPGVLECDGRAATLIGTEGVDVLIGTSRADVIVALGGRDLIDGRGGDDVICAGDGRDVVDAGVGNDVVFGEGGHDDLAGGPGADRLSGGSEADRISGGPDADTVLGGPGDDILRGNDGDDVMHGGNGADRLEGGDGGDRLDGGDGHDTLVGGPGSDIVDGGAGDDELDGNDGDDDMSGGEGDDHIVGTAGSDRIDGGPGADRLLGAAGSDTLHGGDGDDIIRGQGDDDIADGGDGNDLLLGLGGSDMLRGDGGDDRIFGGAGDDVLEGGAGDDLLRGNDGDDVISGWDGDDEVIGDEGRDEGRGGAGVDRCFVESFDASCEVVPPGMRSRRAAGRHPVRRWRR